MGRQRNEALPSKLLQSLLSLWISTVTICKFCSSLHFNWYVFQVLGTLYLIIEVSYLKITVLVIGAKQIVCPFIFKVGQEEFNYFPSSFSGLIVLCLGLKAWFFYTFITQIVGFCRLGSSKLKGLNLVWYFHRLLLICLCLPGSLNAI